METTDCQSSLLLSIVVPMYNAESYISECLESILSQGLPSDKYEIIVINDGSTDNSLKKAEAYALDYPEIKIFSQENQGLSMARNAGIDKAKGRYLTFIDSDDFLYPDSLSPIFNNLKSWVDTEQPYSRCQIITYGIQHGDITRYTNLPVQRDPELEIGPIQNGVDYIASHNYNNGVWWYLVKREYINKIGLRFIKGKLCEDGMFTLSAFINAEAMTQIRRNVYYYVSRPNSITSTNDPVRKRRIIEGFIYAVNYFENVIAEKSDIMSPNCRKRVETRRDSYIFFLLMRLVRMGDTAEIRQLTDDLKSAGLYPIRNLVGEDYPGLRMKIMCALVNRKYSLIGITKALNLISKLRK